MVYDVCQSQERKEAKMMQMMQLLIMDSWILPHGLQHPLWKLQRRRQSRGMKGNALREALGRYANL